MRIILDDPLFIIDGDKVFVDVSEYFEHQKEVKKEPQIFDDTQPVKKVAESQIAKNIKKAPTKKKVTDKPKEVKEETKKAPIKEKTAKVTDFATLEKGGKVIVSILDKGVMGISEELKDFPATVQAITGDILTLMADVPIDGDAQTVWDVDPIDLGSVVEIFKI